MKNLEQKIIIFLNKKLGGTKFKRNYPYDNIRYWGQIQALEYKNKFLYIKGTIHIRLEFITYEEEKPLNLDLNLEQYESIHQSFVTEGIEEIIHTYIFNEIIFPISKFVSVDQLNQLRFELKQL